MLKKTLAGAGLAFASLAAVASPAMAIGDADGSAASVSGNGGTNHTGTVGEHSASYHAADNLNLCLPEVHHVQVGVLVPVQVDVPIANQQQHQICNVGQTTQGEGDGALLSHAIG
ncbi:rodlet layer protein [Kitasatospora sp. NBC_01287]|uniref:rodlet layer protein n=1 Tax=Kitasatospora sp. NBC_01287 TaxID=2903573 RepID=UPI0022597D79|nr:rodlet layer protein [Kitasatospora sp. NBC_01287]MCX4744552.1 rodlet layer protein [Kitasatospora sp. NBC_01287]